MTTKLVVYLATETAHSTGRRSIYSTMDGACTSARKRVAPQNLHCCAAWRYMCAHWCRVLSFSFFHCSTNFLCSRLCVWGEGRGVLFHMAIEHPYKHKILVSFPSLVWFPVWHMSCWWSGNETKPPPLFVICSSVWHSHYYFTFDVMM